MVVGKVVYDAFKKPTDEFKRFFLEPGWKNPKIINFSYSQLTTGSAVEIEMKNGVTITRKTPAGLTLVGAFSADDNYYDGSYVYMEYKDSLWVSHYATMITNTTSTTEVAFIEYSPNTGAVTDVYAVVDLRIYTDKGMTTLLATQAGETFGCGSTGALTLATIAAETSAASELTLAGTTSGGCVWGRYSGDDVSYDNAEIYISYASYAGQVKFGHCTMDGADPTNEIRFYEATDDGDYTTTATATTVKDFYRVRWFYASVQPKADANENVLLTDSACANVDGSGGDVWGMIEEAYDTSLHSRYHAPRQHYSMLKTIRLGAAISTTTNAYVVALTFTPVDYPVAITENYGLSSNIQYPNLDIELKPGTDLSMTVIDVAGAVTVDIEYQIIEAERASAVYPAA